MINNLAEYNLIDRTIKVKFFDKLGKITFLSALILIILTILVSEIQLLDNVVPKFLLWFYGIGTSIMIVFVYLLYKVQSKDFFISQDKFCFLNDKIIIKSKMDIIFSIKQIKRLEFNYKGNDEGPYHPIFNRRQQRGDRNYIIIKTDEITKNYEIYIPTNNELKRIRNFLVNYKMTGIEVEIKNTTANKQYSQ